MDEKPLKPYRSQAERTRVRQGWVQIALTIATFTMQVFIVAHVLHLL